MKDERPAIEDLVDVEQNRGGSGSPECFATRLDRPPFGTSQAFDEPLVVVGRQPQKSNRLAPIASGGGRREDFREFDTPATANQDPASPPQSFRRRDGVNLGHHADSNEVRFIVSLQQRLAVETMSARTGVTDAPSVHRGTRLVDSNRPAHHSPPQARSPK